MSPSLHPLPREGQGDISYRAIDSPFNTPWPVPLSKEGLPPSLVRESGGCPGTPPPHPLGPGHPGGHGPALTLAYARPEGSETPDGRNARRSEDVGENTVPKMSAGDRDEGKTENTENRRRGEY